LSFYTQPKPEGTYGPGHRCIDLDAAEGMLVLDVVAGKIAHVEVFNRNDIRRKLLATLREDVTRFCSGPHDVRVNQDLQFRRYCQGCLPFADLPYSSSGYPASYYGKSAKAKQPWQ